MTSLYKAEYCVRLGSKDLEEVFGPMIFGVLQKIHQTRMSDLACAEKLIDSALNSNLSEQGYQSRLDKAIKLIHQSRVARGEFKRFKLAITHYRSKRNLPGFTIESMVQAMFSSDDLAEHALCFDRVSRKLKKACDRVSHAFFLRA